jgi:hypothetical protein
VGWKSRICQEGSQTLEETADLDALMIAGHSMRGARHRRLTIGLAGKLIVGAAIVMAATGTTIALAHTASARPADSVFVTPGASTAQTGSQDVIGGLSPSVVVSPEADQAGAVQSQGPDSSRSDPVQAEEPYASQTDHLNDGLSDDPGQPRQPAASQDPNSNG